MLLKEKKLARNCKKILSTKPDFFSENIAFYLDGVSFVYKTNPMGQAVAPKGRIWRKKSEGLRMTSKGSKDLAGGKRLHFLVAMAYKKGVVVVEEYEKMSGKYFSRFIREKFPALFSGCYNKKLFVMDNDPSQRSIAATKAIKEQGCELFCIPPRSPDLNPIENLFHVVKNNLECQVRQAEITRETWPEFKTRVRKTLTDCSVDYINNLILSMPKRIDAVIKQKGFRTKY